MPTGALNQMPMADELTEQSDASEDTEATPEETTESTETEDSTETEHSHYEEELKKFPDKEKAADAWKERQQKKREGCNSHIDDRCFIYVGLRQ